MKKVGIILMLFLLIGCGKKELPKKIIESTPNSDSAVIEKTDLSETQMDGVKNVAASIEDIYKKDALSFHILGVREEINEMGHYLILNFEVFNDGGDAVEINGFSQFALIDKKEEEFGADLTAPCHTRLEGTLMSDNKLTGEIGFDIAGSNGDTFVVGIGEMFEYEKALTITLDDINYITEAVFDTGTVTSEYTVGIPVESKCFDVTLDKAEIRTDSDGDLYLACTMIITNNTVEAQNFMAGFCYDAFTAEGINLSTSHLDYTLPATIEAGETVTGDATFKLDERLTSFYLSVTPDLKSYNEKFIIVFDVE
jgi:hypothetical protein